MTGGFQEETVAWIKRRGVRYPYAYDLDRTLVRPFDIFTLPHAILVDPRGIVVYSGPSKDLRDDLIRKTLEGAIDKPMCDWPEAAAPVTAALAGGEYARALALAPLLAASDASLADVPRRVAAMLELAVGTAEVLLKNGELASAEAIATARRKEITAPALRARLDVVLAAIAKVEHGREIIVAEVRAFAILDAAVSDADDGRAKLAELAAIAKAWPGTSADRAAKAATAVVKRLMEQLPK